jgi:predicted nuclease of restriction endonuclease-like RecB superfamily
LVLDIEDKESYKKIIIEIRKLFKDCRGIHYSCYDTGSRGVHIHIDTPITLTKETKDFFCKKYGTDIAKISGKTMIALENTPHWKTGKIKTLIEEYGN